MEYIKLTGDELKKIKKGLFNGGVMTDGCFCGEAVSKFRDGLFVVLYFACRKSGIHNNPHYQVHDIKIARKASELFPKGYMEQLIKIKKDAEFYFSFDDINGCDVYETVDCDLYLIDEELKFDNESLQLVQKKLFKYYKDTYGRLSEAKFKDIGKYYYSDINE